MSGAQSTAYNCLKLLYSGPATDVYLVTSHGGSKYVLKKILFEEDAKSREKRRKLPESFTGNQKTLDQRKVAQSKTLQDGLNEVLILDSVNHPNINCFKDSFVEDGTLCVLSQYCAGGDLGRILRKCRNPLPQKLVTSIIVQLLLGVKYLFNQGILHRDLKPGNIFVDADGRCRIGDFGIAVRFGDTERIRIPMGTPLYMAPEIWMKQAHSEAADVWSLGCVFYELCTRQRLFQGSSPQELFVKVTQPVEIAIPQDYCEELKQLIIDCVTLTPSKRPSVYSLLERDWLKPFIQEYALAGPQAFPDTPVSERRPHPSSIVPGFVGSPRRHTHLVKQSTVGAVIQGPNDTVLERFNSKPERSRTGTVEEDRRLNIEHRRETLKMRRNIARRRMTQNAGSSSSLNGLAEEPRLDTKAKPAEKPKAQLAPPVPDYDYEKTPPAVFLEFSKDNQEWMNEIAEWIAKDVEEEKDVEEDSRSSGPGSSSTTPRSVGTTPSPRLNPPNFRRKAVRSVTSADEIKALVL